MEEWKEEEEGKMCFEIRKQKVSRGEGRWNEIDRNDSWDWVGLESRSKEKEMKWQFKI